MNHLLHSTFHILHSREGQTAFVLILTIAAIAILVGLATAFFAISFVNTGFAFQVSQRAEALANGYAEDGLQLLLRNSLPSGSGNQNYAPSGSTDFGPYSGTVTIQNPSQVSPRREASILSTMTLRGYTRTVQVVASVDPITGQVAVISWKTL